MMKIYNVENEKTKEIRYADLFGGVGGFRLGIERATNDKFNSSSCNQDGRIKSDSSRSNGKRRRTRATCVFYNDIDKYAVQTYNKNFGENWEATDIRNIKTKDIPGIDMLCGGFPCQAFSIAGKRRGFQDTRGTLFFEIARIIKAKRPKIIFLENVKGLLNHEKGKTFSIIIQTISELGYDVQWMVLNSKFFGVPQNRERVFIIGSLRGTSRPEILPFKSSYRKNVKKDTEKQIKRTWVSTIDSRYGQRWSSETYVKSSQADRIHDSEGISPTIPTSSGGRHIPMIVASRGRNPSNPSDRTVGSPTKQRLEVNSEGICNNLTSVQKDHMVMEGTKIRRLTPTECERLQGFPDNWTEGVSDTQRYKQMGNAVTVNVIQAIVEKL